MAWLFSRSSDHAVVNFPQETGKLSLSYIFRHTTTLGSGFPNRHFVVVRGADPLSQANYYTYHDSTKIVLGWTTATSTYQEVYGTWTADLNEHHCLIVVDWDNDTVQVYLDGQPLTMTTTGINTTPQTTGTSMLIGLLQAGSSERFGGYLSHLALWQGIALGQLEAKRLSDRVPATEIAPSYLTRYWRMDASLQGAIYDEIQKAFATLTGPPKLAPGPRDADDTLLRDGWWTRFVRSVAAGGTTYNQACDATSTAVAALLRSVGKPLTATQTGVATLVRQTAKPLDASQTGVASLDVIRAFLTTLSASSEPVATLARATTKVLAATSTAAAALLRQTGKPTTASTTSVADATKQTAKALTATQTGVATLAAIRAFLLSLTASSTGVATIARQTEKPITASSTAVATLARATAKALTATTTSAASAVKAIAKAIAASSTSLAELIATYLSGGVKVVTATATDARVVTATATDTRVIRATASEAIV